MKTARADVYRDPECQKTTKATPLHHLHTLVSAGSTVSNNSAIMQRPSGNTELASKSRSRNLSSADQSWIASRRKTTTTPAKPARATAIWDAVLRASPGSMNYHFNIRWRSGEEYFSKRIPSFVVLLRRRFKLVC